MQHDPEKLHRAAELVAFEWVERTYKRREPDWDTVCRVRQMILEALDQLDVLSDVRLAPVAARQVERIAFKIKPDYLALVGATLNRYYEMMS